MSRIDSASRSGWERDRDVQIGVENDESISMLWLLYGGAKAADDAAQANVLQQTGSTLRTVIADQVAGASASGLAIWTPDMEQQLARAVLNGLDLGSHFYGVWADLDRHGCNELIRIVRRARDQAFGRDE